jgi:outer membrane protein W
MKIRICILIVLFLFNLVSGYAQTTYSGRGRPDQLMIHATPSLSLLDYKSVDSNSSFSGNLGAGLEYAHFFNKYVGLSFGAEVSSFSTFYTFNGRKDSLQLFDNWSSKYYKLRQNLTTKEYQKVTYLSFPIKINYRHNFTKDLNFNVSVGAAYALYITENKSIITGTIDREAFFGDINVNIDEFYPLMFGKFTDYINPSSEKQFKSTVLGIAQMGFSFNLADNWNMHTELNFQYGFQNIKYRSINILVPNEYSGVTATNYIGEIRPISLGLRIGIAYNFDLFGVDCKCHGTWQQ